MTDLHKSDTPQAPSTPAPVASGGPHGQTAGTATPPREPVTAPRKRGRGRSSGAPRTRVSAAFVGAVAGLLVLVLLLVFILENTESVTVNFLGASGRLGLGLALLVGAVAGALIVAILGVARIAQLRKLRKS
jgi:uncharacterized integral membrane protein